MSEQKTENPVKNVYKTSKSTWFIFGLLAVVAIIIIIVMMRKKKDGSTETSSVSESAQ